MRRDSKSCPAAIRLWLLLAATLALAACSAGLKLGYTYADTVVTHSIDGYVGLTPEQEQFVKERTAALMAWHRATQLRDYAQLIEATRARLAGPVTATDVLVFNQHVARPSDLGPEGAHPEEDRPARPARRRGDLRLPGDRALRGHVAD